MSKLSKKQQVVHVSAGSTYSAAVTASGELYTWGRGNYGRLGHGNSEDHTAPTLVAGLRGHRVVDVACGSGDAQTVAVTDTGKLCRRQPAVLFFPFAGSYGFWVTVGLAF